MIRGRGGRKYVEMKLFYSTNSFLTGKLRRGDIKPTASPQPHTIIHYGPLSLECVCVINEEDYLSSTYFFRLTQKIVM